MAAWYVGSVQYTAVAQYANAHVYSVGDIVRQLAAPAVGSERCFRCTTAGTSGGSEPVWILTKGATTNAGTAVFTEVTGNSTHAWNAPSARLALIWGSFAAAGDTIFVSEDHAETQSTALSTTGVGTSAAPLIVLCVNHSGSVPPVSADLRTTATISTTGASGITFRGAGYLYGITITSGNGTSNGSGSYATTSDSPMTFEACTLALGGNNSSSRMLFGATGSDCSVTLINTKISFANATQSLQPRCPVVWKNTASALSGTSPTALFNDNNGAGVQVTADGVDLSATANTLVAAQTAQQSQFTFINCKLNASVTIAATPTSRAGSRTDLIVSDSTSSGNRQERYRYEGTLTRESTVTRTNGATDGTAHMAWKVVTTANAKWAFPFETFPVAIWNTVTGSAITATVEMLTDGVTLNTADIWLLVEYLGASGNPLASAVSSGTADILAAGSNHSTSSTTWTTTGISSPTKQSMSVSFTPQMVGLVRITAMVAKASTTVYIDPKITLS